MSFGWTSPSMPARPDPRGRCVGCGGYCYTLYCDRCAPPPREQSHTVDCDSNGATRVRTDRRRNGNASGHFRVIT